MHRLWVRRGGAALLLVVGAGAGLACGSVAPEGEGTQSLEQSVVGGYSDERDVGVVGLATERGNALHCTGTLIAQNLVLTARHCVAHTATPSGHGEGIICDATTFGNAGSGAMFSVSTDGVNRFPGTGRVVVPEGDGFCGRDIALIVLDGDGIPPSIAQPLVPRIDVRPSSEENYSAVGFGLTSPDGGRFGERMRVDDNAVRCFGQGCDSVIPGAITNSEWLGTARTCPGDSGGPALDETGRVMGVLSRGPEGCLASVYTDVSAWSDLIVSTARKAADQLGGPPPFWVETGSSTSDAGGPLLQSCTGRCSDGFQCLSTDGRTGICVPPCAGADDDSCPSGFSCDSRLNVCSNLAMRETSGGGDDGGCSIVVAGAPASGWPVPGSAAALVLGVGVLLRARSRVRRGA